MTAYHVSRNGKTLGVYPESDARDYYAQGRISPNDLLWREGMPTWVAASEVFGAATPAPPMPAFSSTPTPQGSFGSAAHGIAAPAPPPPKLHWGLVVLFTVLTLGIFYVVWMFIQAAWVKKFNPRSNAITLMVAYVVLVLIGQVISGASPKDSSEAVAGSMLVLAGTIADIVASFSMRRSMLDHYAKTEPIALRLSAALTFFFGGFYLQYHMTRIARWKETGVLPLR